MSLRSDYESHLKKHGVKFNFREGSNKYKTLIALYENIGNWMSKAEIVERIGYTGSDLQDARHLGKQSGWYVDQDGKGNYKLVT